MRILLATLSLGCHVMACVNLCAWIRTRDDDWAVYTHMALLSGIAASQVVSLL